MPTPQPTADIDLDAAGKQHGHVHVPLDAPWQGQSSLALPVCTIAGGSGPTVALLGGNHGDEYEGPIVLGQLIRELDAGAVQGRLIIMPALNLPAVLAQRRESPIDGKNLNRLWPGDPQGTVTQRIVHWLDTEILSRAQVFMDLHTGGRALELIAMSVCHHADEPVRRAQIRAAQEAFNAPLSVELRIGPERPTASNRAHRRGLLVVGTESGGGRPVDAESLANCWHGVRNVLAHLEVLPPAAAPGRAPAVTRFTRKWGHEAEMCADADGVFVPACRLGDEVEPGQAAGQLIRVDRPRERPRILRFAAGGLIAGRRATSGVRTGDVLYWIVRDIETKGH